MMIAGNNGTIILTANPGISSSVNSFGFFNNGGTGRSKLRSILGKIIPAAITDGMTTTNPNMYTIPMSAPYASTSAVGPGCGGNILCAIVAEATIVIPKRK